MITLRVMTQPQFEQYKDTLTESYTEDIARAFGTTIEEERPASVSPTHVTL